MGEIRVFLLKAGVFEFDFEREESKIQVMEMGPWSFDNKPLVLRPWSYDLDIEKEEIDSVPVWIRLPGLKLHMWSTKALSRIARKLGLPLFSDKLTANLSRLAYARICVEIKINSKCSEEIIIENPDGS
uniref:DUF4283 domain-containing protein n=1 Tax=Davidia involucrata TaxID=16924 RepID=A0A5B7BSW9_DAVIN